MSAAKIYEPMSSPRLERWHCEKQYRAKAEECFQLATSAYTPLEKQAWQELGEDWLSLAEEIKEVAVESSLTVLPETS
jgi:hypothetical protein